jgi:type II secretory pathway pseudopilin PulG
VTLLELMAVVTIIGIFVALAVPAMGGILEDRHSARAADELANLFRIGRSRAAATGAAHYIKVDAKGTAATMELRAALSGVAGGPVSSCSASKWSTTDSRGIKLIELSAGAFAGKGISLTPAEAIGGSGTTAAFTEYCFSPGGTPWVRAGGQWVRPAAADVARWKIVRASGGLTRTVRVTPSGLPAIEAE